MKAIDDICNKLLDEIEEGCSKASVYRKQIEKLQVSKNVAEESLDLEIRPEPSINRDKNTTYEDELEFYLDSYSKLKEDFTEEELLEILPSRKQALFSDILTRMMAETYKDIKELEEIMLEDNDGNEDVSEYKTIFEAEKRKIEILKKVLNKSTIIEDLEEEKENQIILVPTESGKFRVLDEIEISPIEYHDNFLELLLSIKNGTFKNVKKFLHNNKLAGIAEVRGYQTRIAFTRIDKNTYALITAFIKKTDSDHFYRSTLERKVAEYRKKESKIKELLKDEDFIKENNLAVDQLFNILRNTKEQKEYSRGDIND